jgi:2-C-methyl-D-erythritol 4-phosphate cytidylyltransferase
MNVGILLAAGHSTRFGGCVSKVLYKINKKPIIQYGIDIFNCLEEIVIVSNSDNHKYIKKLNKNKKVKILINNVNNRLKSIRVALDYLQKKDFENIIIQDAARPYVAKEMIENLLVSSKTFLYSQYYLKLINGLVKKTDVGYEVVNRDNYIELCTPQVIDFHLYNFIFKKYIEKNTTCEVLPLMEKFNIKYNLIEGDQRYLRKITKINDIY